MAGWRDSSGWPRWRLSSAPGTLAWPGGVAAQEPERAGGETVDVELKIVPFYALDEKGKPVYDLRPEEIELRVDGRAVPVDSFDRSRRKAGDESHESLKGPGAGAALGHAATPASPPAAAPRHVFVLFDLAFTPPVGLIQGREVAAEVIERLPASDRLYLLTNHTQTGFRQTLIDLAQVRRKPSAAVSPVEARIPAEGAYVWGVVAVEPASGAAYYKRLFIHDGQAAQPKGVSR